MSKRMHSEGRALPRKPVPQVSAAPGPIQQAGDFLGGLADAGNAFFGEMIAGGSALLESGAEAIGAAGQAIGDAVFGTAGGSNPGEGSAIVVGSAANSEVAYDDSFTPELIGRLQANPDQSLDEILEGMSDAVLSVPGADQPIHHATMAQYGDAESNRGEGETKKSAAFVANSDYVAISDLATPGPEARALEGEITARGYDSTGVSEDEDAPGMRSIYQRLVADANPGDDLFAYYAGHGAPEGLVGTWEGHEGQDDILPNADVAAIVNQATSKGAHIRFVMDSCHSGSAAQAVRDERMNQLAEQDVGLLGQGGLAVAEYARDCKQILLDHLAAREERPDVLQPRYTALEAQLEALRPQYDALNAQRPAEDDLSDEAVAERARIDAAWAALDDQWDAIVADIEELDEHIAWDVWRVAYDAKITLVWASWTTPLTAAGVVTGAGFPPMVIDDYNTLGTQVDFLDNVQNGAMMAADRAVR